MSNDSDQTRVNRGQISTGDQQAETVVERRPVQRQPILTAEPPVTVRRTVETVEPVEVVEAKSSNLSEFIKFGILAVILLGTPLVIWLLNPIIFGQIVPAVLGSNLPQNAPSLPGDQVIQPPTAETPNVVLPTDPQVGIGGEATPTPSVDIITEPDFHIVRSGDTLNSIADQYGLTVADIAAANNLPDQNQIFSGQVLILPPQNSP